MKRKTPRFAKALNKRLPRPPSREQVISFEAPEVLVLAKDETLKHSPTKKVVVLGSVAEQATSGGSASATDYSLQWEQVGGRKVHEVCARWGSSPVPPTTSGAAVLPVQCMLKSSKAPDIAREEMTDR